MTTPTGRAMNDRSADLRGDMPNCTSAQPVIQFSEVKV